MSSFPVSLELIPFAWCFDVTGTEHVSNDETLPCLLRIPCFLNESGAAHPKKGFWQTTPGISRMTILHGFGHGAFLGGEEVYPLSILSSTLGSELKTLNRTLQELQHPLIPEDATRLTSLVFPSQNPVPYPWVEVVELVLDCYTIVPLDLNPLSFPPSTSNTWHNMPLGLKLLTTPPMGIRFAWGSLQVPSRPLLSLKFSFRFPHWMLAAGASSDGRQTGLDHHVQPSTIMGVCSLLAANSKHLEAVRKLSNPSRTSPSKDVASFTPILPCRRLRIIREAQEWVVRSSEGCDATFTSFGDIGRQIANGSLLIPICLRVLKAGYEIYVGWLRILLTSLTPNEAAIAGQIRSRLRGPMWAYYLLLITYHSMHFYPRMDSLWVLISNSRSRAYSEGGANLYVVDGSGRGRISNRGGVLDAASKLRRFSPSSSLSYLSWLMFDLPPLMLESLMLNSSLWNVGSSICLWGL
ncbi:hypothetical protein VNO77_19309 [Canavalia gladiata]|uniref:Uncharacterized protein n=1 Tax=Canavalia gladiata TaxID=3824 RepID=A0AAN9LMH3_CANGL